MSENKMYRVGNFTVTTDELLTFNELLDEIDATLFEDMRKDKTGILLKLFWFFSDYRHPLSPSKEFYPVVPLTPRDFYEFLGSLSLEEKLYYMDEGEKLPPAGVRV